MTGERRSQLAARSTVFSLTQDLREGLLCHRIVAVAVCKDFAPTVVEEGGVLPRECGAAMAGVCELQGGLSSSSGRSCGQGRS